MCLFSVLQSRPKKKHEYSRRKSDTSTSDDEPDVNNHRSATNGEPSVDIFAATADDPLDQHDQDQDKPCGDLYGGGDPCDDIDVMYMEGVGQDMGDMYDPCAYEDPYGGGADVYGGHDDDHDDDVGAGPAEGFCPWENTGGTDNHDHEDDYDHFYAGADEEQDQDGDMGEFGMDFGGGMDEGGDDVGGADYGGDYGGGGCATGDDFGGDDFGGDFGYEDFGGDGGGGYDDDDD